MSLPIAPAGAEPGRALALPGDAPADRDDADDWDAYASAVSWGAIVAGAMAAAALSLILLILGVGLGLSSVSPWAHDGISGTTFGVSTILWLTLTQLVAAATGGYLAGRLRTKWSTVHSDEVYFRDTAHGFLAWAVASLATAAFLTSAIGAIVGTAVQSEAPVASGVAANAGGSASSGVSMGSSDSAGGSMPYFVDSLFRSSIPASASPASAAIEIGTGTVGLANAPTTPSTTAPSDEVSRIFAHSIRSGALPAEDARYLGQVVAQRTGLTQADAERRVTETYARAQARLQAVQTDAKQAAEVARKASARAALWLFISLLLGAFAASLAATFGGRQRDA
ncbi:MAG: hypothetical protein ABIP61_00085 [Burkholderiaceae bacterium]